MGSKIPTEIKDEILTAISQGEKVAQVAQRYGVARITIYNWLQKQTQKGGGSYLEVGRLKRENEALKLLVAEFALAHKLNGKKNRSRGCHYV